MALPPNVKEDSIKVVPLQRNDLSSASTRHGREAERERGTRALLKRGGEDGDDLLVVGSSPPRTPRHLGSRLLDWVRPNQPPGDRPAEGGPKGEDASPHRPLAHSLPPHLCHPAVDPQRIKIAESSAAEVTSYGSAAAALIPRARGCPLASLRLLPESKQIRHRCAGSRRSRAPEFSLPRGDLSPDGPLA